METLKVYTAIIGGGASGLMCACVCSKRHPDKKIVVLERDSRVGKKILVSGNSRCNLSNLDADITNYHTTFGDGVKFLFKNYPPKKVLDYFTSIGLVTKADSEGRVYPLSRQSSAVLSVLRNELKRNGVTQLCDTQALSITKCADGYKIKCNDKVIIAQKVVIATGGRNNHAQKIVADSHNLLKNLGHTVTTLTPSLSPVKVSSKLTKSLKGIRANGKVSAVVNGQIVKSEVGEIQFGADYLSGICVFNLSGILNKADNAEIVVQLLADYSLKEIKDMLLNRVKLVGYDSVQELFTGLFHKNIGIALLKSSNIDTAKTADKLSDKEIEKLTDVINAWRFKVMSSNDFAMAQVTSGGVIGCEINPATLESKLLKNVYLCGEAIDVDGDCGGYNLQFAFSSGMCVGELL